MKWYQVKEQAAGLKRLLFMYYLYRICGKKAVKCLTFFVTFFAFIFGKEVRGYSKKYLPEAGVKPTLVNQFRHFLSYSDILIDNMETFINKFDPHNITFSNEETKNEFFNCVIQKKGGFFISSHLGNIHVLRSFLSAKYNKYNVHVNIFLSENQCKIFNEFIRRIMVPQADVTTYPVEQINVSTPIEIKEKLDRGELVFIAGDRVSETGSTVFQTKFLGRTVEFPLGTFTFAKLMDCPTFFIVLVKTKGDKYITYIEKAPANQKEMQTAYVKFLENLTRRYPLQFYHFYDIFVDGKTGEK